MILFVAVVFAVWAFLAVAGTVYVLMHYAALRAALSALSEAMRASS